jgi:hypothetical protein
MVRGDSPEANIFSNTSFASLPLIVPSSMRRMSSPSAWGRMGLDSTGRPVSLILRSSSDMIQLLVALGLEDAAAAASKKPARARFAVRTRAS